MAAREFLLGGASGLWNHYVHPPNLHPKAFFDLHNSITRLDWAVTRDPFGTYSYAPGEAIHKIGVEAMSADLKEEAHERRTTEYQREADKRSAFLREIEGRKKRYAPTSISEINREAAIQAEHRPKKKLTRLRRERLSNQENERLAAVERAEKREKQHERNLLSVKNKSHVLAHKGTEQSREAAYRARVKNLRKRDRILRASILPSPFPAQPVAEVAGEPVARQLFPTEGPPLTREEISAAEDRLEKRKRKGRQKRRKTLGHEAIEALGVNLKGTPSRRNFQRKPVSFRNAKGLRTLDLEQARIDRELKSLKGGENSPKKTSTPFKVAEVRGTKSHGTPLKKEGKKSGIRAAKRTKGKAKKTKEEEKKD